MYKAKRGVTLGHDSCNLQLSRKVSEANCWTGVTLCNDSCNLFQNRHRGGFPRINWWVSTNRCETSYAKHCEGAFALGNVRSTIVAGSIFYNNWGKEKNRQMSVEGFSFYCIGKFLVQRVFQQNFETSCRKRSLV